MENNLIFDNNFFNCTKNNEYTLTIEGFNKNSQIKVLGYRNHYNMSWLDILIKFGKYQLLLNYVVSEYKTFIENTNKKSIQTFCKNHKYISYRLLESIGLDYIKDKTNVQKLRYTELDYKNNFENIKEELNRVPLFKEFSERTKITLNSYVSKFDLKGKAYLNLLKRYCSEEEIKIFMKNNRENKGKIGSSNSKTQKKYSIEILENNLKEVFELFFMSSKQYPSRRIFDKISYIDSSVYRKYFNLSWVQLCQSIGYEYDSKITKSEKACLNKLSSILHVPYIPQKNWKWLIGAGGGRMYCDGYFEELKLIVEFDGVAHRIPKEVFGGKEKFKRQIENDKLKEKLLIEHGYKIIRIDSRDRWYEEQWLKGKMEDELSINLSS